MSEPWSLDFKLSGLLNQKAAQVEEASARKKAEMAPSAAENYWAEYDKRMERQLANSNRGLDQLIDDAGPSLAKGAYNLASSNAQMLREGFRQMPINVEDPLRAVMRSGAAGKTLKGIAEAQDSMDSLGMSWADRQVDEALSAQQSDVSQTSKRVLNQDVAAASAENLGEYQQAVARGDSKFLAGAARLGKNAVDAGGLMGANGTALFDTVVEQVPNLLAVSQMVKGGAGAGAVQARASKVAGKMGGEQGITDELMGQARSYLQKRELAAVVGATEGAGAYQQGVSSVQSLPWEELVQQYPGAMDMVASGMSPAEVRTELGREVGRTAAAIQAPVAAVTSRLAAGFNISPLSAGVGSAMSRSANIAGNVIGEMAEEGAQGATGALSGNLARVSAGAEGVDLGEGVGEAAGQGVVAALGLSGAFQTPAAAGVALELGARGAYGVGKAVTDGVKSRIDGIETGLTAQEAAQRAMTDTKLQADAASLSLKMQESAAAAPVGTPVSPVTAPVEADPILSPATVQELKGEDPSIDRVTALSRALTALDRKDLTPEKRKELMLFSLRVSREISNETFEDEGMQQAANNLIGHEQVLAMEGVAASWDDATLQAQFDQVPDNPIPEGTVASPEVIQAIEAAKEMAYLAPERMTVPMAQKLVHHSESSGSQQDKDQAKLVLSLATLQADHAKALEAINKVTPFKAQSEVTADVAETGFDLNGKQLKSFRQHVRAVATAAVAGRTQEAQLAMADLAKFTGHMAQKASLFNAAAIKHIDEGKSQEHSVDVEGTKQLDSLTTLGTKKNWVNLNREGSVGLIDAIYADSNAVAQAYNSLAQAFPKLVRESQGDATPLPAKFEAKAQPSWKSHTRSVPKTEKVDASPAVVPVDAGAQSVAAPTVAAGKAEPDAAAKAPDVAVVEAKQPEAPVADAARGTARSATSAEQAKSLSDEVLNDRINVLQDKRKNKTYTKEDAATFAVLDTEMTAREDAAVAEAARVEEEERAEAAAVEQPAEAVETPKTLEERFPNLRTQIGEADPSMSVADQYWFKNKFFHAYTMAAKATGLFARLPSAIAAVIEKLANPAELYEKNSQHLAPKAEEIAGYRTLFEKVIPALVQALNTNLNNQSVGKGAEGKDNSAFLKRLLDPTKGEWNFFNRLSLNTVEILKDDKGEVTGLQYAPEIADAIATAGMHWLMKLSKQPARFSLEKMTKIYGYRLTPEIMETGQNAHYYEQPIEELARDIKEILGLQDNDAASVSLTNGIATALALDVAETLVKQGLLDVVTHKLAPSTDKNAKVREAEDRVTIAFMSFNERPNEDKAKLDTLIEQIGPMESLTRLLFPERVNLGHTGAPPKRVATKISGTNQNMSPDQQAAVQKRQNVPQYLNQPYLGLLDKLGLANYLSLRGIVDPNAEGAGLFNKMDKASRTSKYLAAVRAWENLTEVRDVMGRYAETNGMALRDVAQYYDVEMVKNSRISMKGIFHHQNNKLARTTLSPNRVTLNLEKPADLREFRLALAQSLGFKIEREVHDDLLARFEDVLAEKYGVVADLIHELTQAPEASAELTQNLMAEIQRLVAAKDLPPISDAVLHALYAFSASKHTTTPTAFETSITAELDGVTDGPIHAMVQLGLYAFNANTVHQLRQGGVFVGSHAKPTLNEYAKNELGDLYRSGAEFLKNAIIGKAQSALNGGTTDLAYTASVSLLNSINYVVLPEAPEAIEDIDVTRDPGKATLMPTTYGSASKALMRVIVDAVATNIYKEMTAGLSTNSAIPQALQDGLSVLLARDPENPSRTLRVRDMSNPASYAEFRFSEDELARIAANLEQLAGGDLIAGVNGEMAAVLDSYGHFYKLSAAKSFLHKRAFEKAYTAKRDERVAAGEIGKKEALSRADEREILASIRHLAPIIQLLTTQDGDDSTGLDITKTSRQGRFEFNGEAQKTGPMLGGQFSMHIPAFVIEPPGVRVAAMATVALGDGTMMAQTEGNNPNGTGQVYDGWDVSPGQLAQRSVEINTAVGKAMAYHGMQALVDAFAFDMADIEALSLDEIQALGKSLMMWKDDKQTPQEYADSVIVELMMSKDIMGPRARSNAAVQDVLFGQGTGVQTAIDHMASAMAPALIEGEAIADQGDGSMRGNDAVIAKEVWRMVNGQPATVVEAAPVEKPTRLMEVAKPAGSDLARFSGNALIDLLKSVPFKSKLHQFVFNSLKHLISDNLQVFIGTPEAIAAKQQELFPGNDFSTPEGGRSNGTYLKGVIFVENGSETTLIHELVHATTLDLVDYFYNGGASKMTAAQRGAIASLESLMMAFVSMKSEDQTFNHVQNVITTLIGEGDVAAAVNEFMAYTLTDRRVAADLQKREGISRLKAMAKQVLSSIRTLLGLPNNAAVETFLEQALGQMQSLASNMTLADMSYGTNKTMHSLMGPTDIGHARHVDEVQRSLQRMIAAIPARALDKVLAQTNLQEAFLHAAEIQEGFLDAGFELSDQEKQVFAQYQAVLASGAQLDANTLNLFQSLYDDTVKQLDATDFMEDPTSENQDDRQAGQRRLDAMLGVGTQKLDAQGRSNLLANFIALSQVYQPLRKKLATLQMPKAVKGDKTADGQIRAATTAASNWFAKFSNEIGKVPHQQKALDLLTFRLTKIEEAAIVRSQKDLSKLVQAENWIKDKLTLGGELAAAKEAERVKAGLTEGTDAWVNTSLKIFQNISSEKASAAYAEEVMSMTNKSPLPAILKKLIAEMVGITESNAPIAALLDQAKHVVSRARQRLRDEAPKQVRQLFAKKLPHKTWEILHKVAARSDMQALLGANSIVKIQQMLSDSGVLTTEIQSLEAQLAGKHQAAWSQGARDLGRYMVGQGNEAVSLRSNATALSHRVGEGVVVTKEDRALSEPLLDRLITLRAIEALSDNERAVVAKLFTDDAKGMESLLRLLGTLTLNEMGKPDSANQKYNRWKGYVPESLDPRGDLVLANPKRGGELLKQGYRLVAQYDGDRTDPSAAGLAYYASNATVLGLEVKTGGQSTYTQGAMQTVEGTVGGVDRLTGGSENPGLKTMITDVRTVGMITAAKQRGVRVGNRNLRPIFNNEGVVKAYERVLDTKMLDVHLRGNRDLSKAVGSWMGRQAEEQLAKAINKDLVQVLKNQWDLGKAEHREGEYEDISKPVTTVQKDRWNAIPRETQDELKAIFGKGNPVMVRVDVQDNALGYRAASVTDVFTGASDLPDNVRKALETAAYGVLGKNAYAILKASEKSWMGLVGSAKDWIVVRSGVVVFANAFANQFQLLTHDIPALELVPRQARKALEVETYQRNEVRLARIMVEKAIATRPDVLKKLSQEEQMLMDTNSRLSIAPLINAGMLPSITEGLSEQDEYNVVADLIGWVEKKADAMPKGLMTAAKYAVVSKDTALYQGLNRGIQYGDFVAKAVLYDKFLADGMDPAIAMRKISERFVNYNLLAGRARDWAESMGLTWFASYKIRIQKVILASMRENPLRFLMAGVGADMLGADSLASSNAANVSYSTMFGPGQFFRTSEMNVWRQLFGF